MMLDPMFKMEYYQRRTWEPEAAVRAKDALVQAMKIYNPLMLPSERSGPTKPMFPWQVVHAIYGEKQGVQDEMEEHLSVPKLPFQIDVLEWWKQHSGTYPSLAHIARDYLAIPATSTPVKRAFSAGSNPIANKRASLEEDAIEACMCVEGWPD